MVRQIILFIKNRLTLFLILYRSTHISVVVRSVLLNIPEKSKLAPPKTLYKLLGKRYLWQVFYNWVSFNETDYLLLKVSWNLQNHPVLDDKSNLDHLSLDRNLAALYDGKILKLTGSFIIETINID